MKVHPVPRKRNSTLRYDSASALSQPTALSLRQKKLRRLPHIFAKVLELPFHSNAEVFVEETADCFRFVAGSDDEILRGGIRAHAIDVYPGITKVVVSGAGFPEFSVGELELDVWRFRLPASARPELASACYDDGELAVTVPKDANYYVGADVGDDELVW